MSLTQEQLHPSRDAKMVTKLQKLFILHGRRRPYPNCYLFGAQASRISQRLAVLHENQRTMYTILGFRPDRLARHFELVLAAAR
jgi:hypothetical protein